MECSTLQEAAWHSIKDLPDRQRWKAFINRLCVLVFGEYLREDHLSLPLLPEFEKLSEYLEGAAIAINRKRLVLVPTEAWDVDEMRVMSEWVDVPSLAADYFVAARVDIERHLLQLYGFCTHARLIQKGERDERDRTISLSQYDLLDMSALFPSLKLCPDEQTKGAIEPLPPIDSLATKEIHDSISAIGFWATRRKVPEAQWKALLNNESTRKRILSLLP